MLPLNTIVSGVHVKLDVQKQKLIVADPVKDSRAVIVKEYTLHTLEATLDFFEYLDAQKDTGRFLSVKIV